MAAVVGANASNKGRIAFLGAVATLLLIISSAIWTPAVQSTNSSRSDATQRDASDGITPPPQQQTKSALQESRTIERQKPDNSKRSGKSDNAATRSSKPRSPRIEPETLKFEVLHQHLLGTCQGTLTIGSESILFVPSASKKHGFKFKLTEIVSTEKGDKLKIKFKQATYRFKAKTAKSAADDLLAAIDSGLNRARSQATQNLKSKG